ncbi:MAG: DUF5723 family protein [Flavobacteriales bacterium]
MMDVPSYAQLENAFWQDQDNINAAFVVNPAFLTSGNAVIALPFLTVSQVGNNQIDNGPFKLVESELDRSFKGEKGVDLQNTFGAAHEEGNLLSRQANLLGGAISSRVRSKKHPERRITVRLAYLSNNTLDIVYSGRFAAMALSPLFSMEVPYTSNVTNNFELRYMDYRAIALGGTIEVRPLQTYVGVNLKLLGGSSFIVADINNGITTVLSKGTDLVFSERAPNSNFLNGKGVAIDVGAVHRISRVWSLMASLVDLGFISWPDAERFEVRNNQEILLGLEPLNELTGQLFLASAYAPLLNDLRSDGSSNEKVRTSLQGRTNLGVEGLIGRWGVHVLVQKAIRNWSSSADATVIASKASYWLLDRKSGRLGFSVGVRYGSDTEFSITSSLRADLKVVDFYFGLNGLSDGSQPYGRSMLMLGIQINTAGITDRDRL